MFPNKFPNPSRQLVVVLAAALLLPALCRADMIELINGDHYRGTVIGMTTTNVDFLSEMQGRVTLSRAKIAQITLHNVIPKPTAAPTNQASATPAPATSPTGTPLILSGPPSQGAPAMPPTVIIEQMRQQGVDPALIQQVQQQIFGKASPEAAQQFNQTMNGLMSGSISVQDIRKQAQSSIAQIKAAKADLGPDTDDLLNGYLAILEKFVQEAATDNTVAISTPVPSAPAAYTPGK